MGFTILPICKHCGYKTESIFVGGGRLNHLTVCGAPVLNVETNEIERINLYKETKKIIVKKKFLFIFNRKMVIEKLNDKYIPYFNSKMFIDDKSIDSHIWMNRKYKKSKNFCPKCKTFNLNFEEGGMLFD